MIKLLPEDVWSKIAAGEVVERPGSVVKELVENSIDGGAKRIRVSLWDGGKTRIVVEDDGAGISFDDLPLAVSQHATSKLSAAEDLNSIFTLGYRGEAIASIASVSGLEIRSCPENESGGLMGGLIRVRDGRTAEHARTTCPKGTRVQIDDLFFNMPARKKFLKAALSELRRCSVILRDYALAWPEISLGLSHEGKALFTTDGSGDKKRAVSQIWGVSPEPLTARVVSGNLSLECWYQPFPARGRNEISAFVNRRAVNDPVIRAAVSNAGKELSGNWALFITVDPSLIDVNIHPAKAEIRFRYTGEVFDAVKKAAETLSGSPAKLVYAGGGGDISEFQPQQKTGGGANNFGSGFSMASRPQNLFSRAASSLDNVNIAEKGSENDNKSWNFDDDDGHAESVRDPEVRFISQLSSGYLIFETQSALVIMDPHAAHERVMYERIADESERGIKSQALITPEPLQPTLALQAQEYETELREAGFSFREDNGLFITGVPSVPGNAFPPLPLLRAALSAWSEGESGRKLDGRLMARWAEIACKASVKLTNKLQSDEALTLWGKLHSCRQPYACPHGRPTVLKMEHSELTKHFGRSG